MAKKKLLNEAQVRRFMGLAGMNSSLVSNTIKEMQVYEDEPVADEELPPEEMEMAPEEPEMAPEEPEMAPEEPEADAEVEVSSEEVADLKANLESALEFANKLGGAEEPVADMEEPAEEPMADLEEPAEEEEIMEEENLEEVELQLSEDEIVQEVARRVAKRILRAKKAKQELDEALGRKK